MRANDVRVRRISPPPAAGPPPPDPGQDQGDVVLAVLAHGLGDRLAGVVQRHGRVSQGGAQRLLQRLQPVVQRLGPALHQPVGVQGQGGAPAAG